MIKQLVIGALSLAAIASPGGVAAATTAPQTAPLSSDPVARPAGEIGLREAAITNADDRRRKRRAAALLLPAGGAAAAGVSGGGAVSAGVAGMLAMMLGAIAAFDDDAAADAVSP